MKFCILERHVFTLNSFPFISNEIKYGQTITILSIAISCRYVLLFGIFVPLNCTWNRIIGVMISVLASSGVDHGLETRSGQTKDYIKLVFVAS